MMIKRISFVTAILILIIGSSCKKIYEQAEPVVINELMPVNSTTVADNYGEYDDWIELYNLSPSPQDLTGCYLSDKKATGQNGSFRQAHPYQGTATSLYGLIMIPPSMDCMQTLSSHLQAKR